MAKKKSAEKKEVKYACPSCKAEVKPTFWTITGIVPLRCKCGKYLVANLLVSAIVLGLCFAVWYSIFLLTGLILPGIAQIFLLPIWIFFGYKYAKRIMFKFVIAKEIKNS